MCVKGVWVATNKSGNRANKIGEYETREAARHAVDLQFGLTVEGQ